MLTKCRDYKPVSPCLASFTFLNFISNLPIGFSCHPKVHVLKPEFPVGVLLTSSLKHEGSKFFNGSVLL